MRRILFVLGSLLLVTGCSRAGSAAGVGPHPVPGRAPDRPAVTGTRTEPGMIAATATRAAGTATSSGTPTGNADVEDAGEFFYGARTLHTATPLPDGRILIAGGTGGRSLIGECEVYDPAAPPGAHFAPAAPLNVPRIHHTAVALLDGRVLVLGGFDGTQLLDVVELYEPATNRWDVLPAPLRVPRAQHRTVLVAGLAPTAVLVMGGLTGAGGEPVPTNASEIYDLDPDGDGDYADAEARYTRPPVFARTGHSMTLLPGPDMRTGTADDWVLVYGGWGAAVQVRDDGSLAAQGLAVLGEPELYRPWDDLWTTVDANCWYPEAPAPDAGSAGPRRDHCAVLLSDGRVLVVGGHNGGGAAQATGNSLVRTAEVFVPDYSEPAASRILASARLSVPRHTPTATALARGRALVAGGYDGGEGQVLSTAEVFVPGSGQAGDVFSAVGSLGEGRIFHTATALPSIHDGTEERVLFLGGSAQGGAALSAGELMLLRRALSSAR